MLEKLYISFILELMSDLFEACDPQDDGMELYEMLYPSASCEKFVRESGLDEDDSETEDNFLDTDLDGPITIPDEFLYLKILIVIFTHSWRGWK